MFVSVFLIEGLSRAGFSCHTIAEYIGWEAIHFNSITFVHKLVTLSYQAFARYLPVF